ncbi:ABC transporter ATP-binding protein [Cellulosilyticum sp. WCF-2]|uniref:ABC transporter ATP-binding protein n=1 Tax=Cellulosilyticum sp. WCF-2 TaxID=2497860 RepID=UPI000F8DA35C|nr:ABC transporter ATP-binding protein [Cellulosilyticum sp. WCF-2]QEH67628.1 ABC transporter ATP-binding protein [Cellulosilyticum sp. WCF-2]
MFLEVTDLVKTYETGAGNFNAMEHVSFHIHQGEIAVILGPSGSGKSTLMNIVGGLESATSGSLKVEGKEISTLSPKALGLYRRDTVGFVFQFYNLIPNLTVRENVEICSHLGKEPLDIDELLTKVGLTEQTHKFPSQLSGGQQQRVAIARALVKNPKLLLCDEPTGALDYKTSKEVLALFEEINRNYHTTILMITHNDAFQAMSHRTIRIKDGKILSNELNKTRKTIAEIDW